MKLQCDLTDEQFRQSCDWEYIFDNFIAPEAIIGDKRVSAERFTRDDVKRVIGIVEGENDGPDWVGVFEIAAPRRYAAVSAGCDYTGWG